jgi:D-alanyl-D-alanine carboxypeptidase
MRRVLVILLTSSALLFSTTPSFSLELLDQYLRATELAQPGVLIIDPKDGSVLAENRVDEVRIPASVLKLLSATTALTYLGADKRFETSIWSTSVKNSFVLIGEMDPWLTSNLSLAKKNKQRYLPTLVNKANAKEAQSITIYYSGLYSKDLQELSKHLAKRKIKVKAVPIAMKDARGKVKEEIAGFTSEPMTTMVSFAILWSDNQLADRLATTAVKKAGNPVTPQGMTATFKAALSEIGVSSEGLNIEDGSGLSKANRISPRTLVELLIKIRNNPRFQSIYDGLPIGGRTGTLAKRFANAPDAVDHVHAKTGFLSNVVSLAGYVESGNNEYVFVILVDGIRPRLSERKAAREVMDQMLNVIAKGNLQTP